MSTELTCVLVLDGEQRAALAIVRSLGRRGRAVHVGSSVPCSIAGGSRHAVTETLLPDPLSGAERYAAAVRSLAATTRAATIIAVTDASTLALLEFQERFAGISLATSDFAHFRHASDKAAVLALAPTVGIAVPEQWSVTPNGDPTLGIPLTAYPVVVKPSRSVAGPTDHRRKVGVDYANSPDDVRRIVAQLAPGDDPILVQRRVEGPGFGIFLLRWNGEIVASFAHRRIREKPPSGGVSVCSESIAAPDALIARSAALLAALDWSGVAMVEYKHDTRSGRDFLMEINPRFWGSLQLAIDAGVDFPWYLAQLASGQQVPPVQRWQVGTRSRWWLGDVDHLIARLRQSRAALHLPENAPGLLRTALSVFTPWRPGQQNDVFRLSDPRPAVRELIAWIRAL